jgi:Mu-like prophage major head subunit gpT
MPVTRGQFAQLLAAGLFSVIYEDLSMHPEEYPEFFNVYSSTKTYEEDQLVAGLGSVPTKPEGEAIKLDQPIQGGSIRYQHVSYGLGFQVTREMWDDDQYGIMKKVSQDFGGSIRQTVEATDASVLNNSFTTQLSIDGVSLINTAHPLLGGGTYSNKSATNVAFSTTGMTELILLFEKMVNERGLIKRMIPEEVWIPVDLQFKAGEILHSAYKPYTGNNEINVMQGRLMPRVNHYFSSTTGWWVAGRKSDQTLKHYWRIMPEFDSQDDFFTKGASYSVYFRFVSGVTYWHGIAGSPGV